MTRKLLAQLKSHKNLWLTRNRRISQKLPLLASLLKQKRQIRQMTNKRTQLKKKRKSNLPMMMKSLKPPRKMLSQAQMLQLKKRRKRR